MVYFGEIKAKKEQISLPFSSFRWYFLFKQAW